MKEFEQTVLKPKAIRMEHWETAKKAIRAVAVAPKGWYFEPWHFYNWFIDKKYCTDYSNRIRRLLNEWGRFLSRKQNSFWQDVPAPSLHWRTKIRIAQRKAKGRQRPASRLSLETLESKKDHLDSGQYNRLYISIGARVENPNEWLKDQVV